jgi:hypothetical protein
MEMDRWWRVKVCGGLGCQVTPRTERVSCLVATTVEPAEQFSLLSESVFRRLNQVCSSAEPGENAVGLVIVCDISVPAE